MDEAVLLGLLVVVVAVDTVAILTILVLTVRGRARPDRASAETIAVPAAVASAAPNRPTPGARPSADAGEPAVPPAEPIAAEPIAAEPIAAEPVAAEPDQLADAITAFLGRSEGLFRAGVGPGAPVAPTPSSPPAILDRPRPEVTWAPARPARYVASGPRSGTPTDDPAVDDPGRDLGSVPPPTVDASPDPASRPTARPGLEAASPGLFGSTEPPAPAMPPRRPASRLRVALAEREAAEREAAAETIARLGPVIGGLLRERTRDRDRIEIDGPGSYWVVLPETSRDGAEALGRRLAATCDAWLAVELPPLWLDLRSADLPGGVPLAAPEPGWDPAAERRRHVVPDA